MSKQASRALDFAFLDGAFRAVRPPAQPVNVFAIAGFPRRETVASNVLAYFLDPSERHLLGTAVVDALITCLEGAHILDARGIAVPQGFRSRDYMASTAWVVQTEVVTDDLARIDVYLTNDELGLAIVVENKVDAVVNNPFSSYVARAARDCPHVVCVVLAPTRRGASLQDSAWISAAVTYDDLFDALDSEGVGTSAPADARSMTLLDQFIENFSERSLAMDHAKSAAVLESYWSAIGGREAQVSEYFRAVAEVNAILKARGRVLAGEIEARLKEMDVLRESWFTLGMDHTWGRLDGRVTIAYVAFQLRDLNCIELMLGNHPPEPWTGFAVKAYPQRSRAGDLYDDFNHVPLGLPWTASDEDVVEAFVAAVLSLIELHPRPVTE